MGTEARMNGDLSTLMNKLNEIVTHQNDEKELDRLWRLCLLSLMIDDGDERLNQIMNDKMKKKEIKFTLSPKEDVIETSIDNELIQNEKVEEIGGLIGEMLNGKNDALDNEDDVNNDDDEVVVDEFKGDKVVFQSGNDDKVNEYNEEEIDLDTNSDIVMDTTEMSLDNTESGSGSQIGDDL